MSTGPPLHVGFDLLFLVPGESGGRETYARELMQGLRRSARQLSITAFVNAQTADAGPGFWTESADRTVPVPVASPASRTRWAIAEHVTLPRAAARAAVDVLHSPANIAPVGGRFARVLTLHDLLFTRPTTRFLVRRGARAAHGLITGSEAVRDELAPALAVRADRIAVIPHGLPEPGAAADAAQLRDKFALGPRPVLLTVGADLPHKNLGAALAGVAELNPQERPVLICVGRETDGPRLRAVADSLGVDNDVRLIGAVGRPDLEALYSVSRALIAPAFGEGFGLTVLEAMARGVTVAASDIPSHREVAGDFALWFDPADAASVAAAIRAALDTGPETERLRDDAAARAATFSWDAATARTLDVYDAALAVRHGRSR